MLVLYTWTKAYSVLAIRSCYIASANFDVCQCKVGLFSNVQSLITLFHGSLCMPNCLICMFIVVTSCLYKRVCQLNVLKCKTHNLPGLFILLSIIKVCDLNWKYQHKFIFRSVLLISVK